MKSKYSSHPIYGLVLGWVLEVPVLFFVARGTFSFDRTQFNNQIAANTGTITATGDSASYYRAELTFMYVIVCALLLFAMSRITREAAKRRNLWILLLPMWAAASIIWSQDPIKTLLNSFTILLLTLLGIYIAVRFTPDRQIDFFLFTGVIALAACYLLVFVDPVAAVSNVNGRGGWQGLFAHKNHCGIVMTYLMVPAFCISTSSALKRFGLAVYVFACLFLIFRTQSRTGWLLALCILGFIALAKLARRFAWKEKILLAAVTVLLVGLISAFCFSHMSELVILIGKDVTLTGRTDIWAAIWPVLGKRPFLGYGYRAFWLGMHGESANLNLACLNLSNAENAVLQMWLELGAVGVFVMCGGILAACKSAWRANLRHPSNSTLWWSANIVLSVLALVDGDKIMFPSTIEWLLFVTSFVALGASQSSSQETVKELETNGTQCARQMAG